MTGIVAFLLCWLACAGILTVQVMRRPHHDRLHFCWDCDEQVRGVERCPVCRDEYEVTTAMRARGHRSRL